MPKRICDRCGKAAVKGRQIALSIVIHYNAEGQETRKRVCHDCFGPTAKSDPWKCGRCGGWLMRQEHETNAVLVCEACAATASTLAKAI